MIKHINIDPNGVCNAKCWFCPVAYLGNPKENRGTMSIETMESILKQIDEGRGDFVDPDIDIVNNPIHYNETLLYPYFKEMLDLHRKYNIKMYIFSNGVNLTIDKTDLIKDYSDVVTDVILNVPSIEKDQWSKFTGFNPKLFDKLINNLQYASDILSDTFKGEQLMILVNGISPEAKIQNGGWMEVLENAPFYSDSEHRRIVDKMQEMFPKFMVSLRNNLSDRTNVLSELKIISNQSAIQKNQKGKVIACGNKYPDQELFISATGNVYLCCADFNYETTYENINNKTIKEIWNSQERQDAIKKAYAGVCTSCFRAVWDEGIAPPLTSSINIGLNLLIKNE
jgi:radical SAM protein with 4Fe4S-binding SPASM domain